MPQIINVNDQMSQALEIRWDQGEQEINDPNVWKESGIAREVNMPTTGGKVPRVGSGHHIVPWSGTRMVQGISYSEYTWAAQKFESTLGIDRDDMTNLSHWGNLFDGVQAMGAAKARFRNDITFGFLEASLAANTYTYTKLGQSSDPFNTRGYDNQRLFSTTHPNGSGRGSGTAISNIDASGSGNPYWYLVDDRAVPAILIGKFRKFDFYEYTAENSVLVDNNRKWGQDGRFALAAGDYRSIYASSLPLTIDNLKAAILAMGAWQNEDGTPANIRPSRLVIPTALQFDAKEALKSRVGGGDDNVMQGSVQPYVVPYLSATAA